MFDRLDNLRATVLERGSESAHSVAITENSTKLGVGPSRRHRRCRRGCRRITTTVWNPAPVAITEESVPVFVTLWIYLKWKIKNLRVK